MNYDQHANELARHLLAEESKPHTAGETAEEKANRLFDEDSPLVWGCYDRFKLLYHIRTERNRTLPPSERDPGPPLTDQLNRGRPGPAILYGGRAS